VNGPTKDYSGELLECVDKILGSYRKTNKMQQFIIIFIIPYFK